MSDAASPLSSGVSSPTPSKPTQDPSVIDGLNNNESVNNDLANNDLANNGLAIGPIARSMMDTRGVAVLISDAEGRFVDCNAEAARRLKYSRQELLGLTIDAINPDLDMENDFRKDIFPNLQPGDHLQLKMRHQRKDGVVFPVEIDAHKICVDERWYIVAMVRDVRMTNLETLIHVNERLRATIYVYDLKKKRSLYVNQNIGAQLGYSPDEVLDMHDQLISRLLHPEDAVEYGRHIEAIASMGDDESLDFEYQMMHRDGHYRRMVSRDAVFKRDEHGDVAQIVGIATVLDDLEVLRRTTEQLEAANEELQHFAYVASHDLKQPLRGIAQLADWIREDCQAILPEDSRDHLDKLHQRVGRLQRLLDDLLIYSRVGRVELPVVPFSLLELFEELRELLPHPETMQIASEGLELEIVGHRAPLLQVLQNLIGNAIKHRRDDHAKVRVVGTVMGGRVQIDVIDNGPGISQQHRERVFEMFQTLARGPKTSTGIGLTIARKQVRQYGSDLQLMDTAEGCHFRFDWPLKIR